MYRIGIVGSRRRNTSQDKELLLKALGKIWRDDVCIVSGGCPTGADKFAEEIAKASGCTMVIHHAAWNKYGKAAGPIRNSKIAQDCEILIALPSEDRTGGTEDTIKKTLVLGKKVVIVQPTVTQQTNPPCTGWEQNVGKKNAVPCCDRAGEYNGFGSDGPLAFTCPKSCSCHD